MIGRIHRGDSTGEHTHYLTVGNQEVPLHDGTSVKVHMRGKWMRGRYEINNEEPGEALLNAGDARFSIPEGTEVEIV